MFWCYSKTCVKRPLQIDKTKILMTNGCLMKVGKIAEWSCWSILQYFWHALSHNWSWKPIFRSFWEWPFYTGFTVQGSMFTGRISTKGTAIEEGRSSIQTRRSHHTWALKHLSHHKAQMVSKVSVSAFLLFGPHREQTLFCHILTTLQRCRPTCAAAQSGQHICCSLIGKYHV